MTSFSPLEATMDDFRFCQLYTRRFAKTFYFASHVLPKEKRMAAYALYAFSRHADEMVDSAASLEASAISRNLALLQDDLKRVYSGESVEGSRLRAFQTTVVRYEIPMQYFIDLIRGLEMDLRKKRYADFKELDEYCYCVASTIGLIMTRVFGAADLQVANAHAVELGKAMQLTNILRDVGEDYRRGRIYLPGDELLRFGICEEDIGRGALSSGYIDLMKFSIGRARMLYEKSAGGVPLLTDDGSRLCVTLMSLTYASILDEIAAIGYDTLTQRAYVPLLRKIGIALGGSWTSYLKILAPHRGTLPSFDPAPPC